MIFTPGALVGPEAGVSGDTVPLLLLLLVLFELPPSRFWRFALVTVSPSLLYLKLLQLSRLMSVYTTVQSILVKQTGLGKGGP